MLWRLLKAGAWLLVLLFMLELAFYAILVYYGLNPAEIEENFKRLSSLVERLFYSALYGIATGLQFIGVSLEQSRFLAAWIMLFLVLACYPVMFWLIYKIWQTRLRVWREIRNIWQNKKAAPP